MMHDNYPLHYVLCNYDESKIQGYDELVPSLTVLRVYVRNPIKLDLNVGKKETPTMKPSDEEPSNLKLKVLPSHLKYVFFGPNNTLIIATDLHKK